MDQLDVLFIAGAASASFIMTAAETIYQIVSVPQDLPLWIRLPKYFG
jgi:hypothetical protein